MTLTSLEEEAPSALATITLSLGGVEFFLTSNINNAVGTTNSGANGKRNNMVSISEMCNDEVLIQLNNFTGTLRVKKHDVDSGGGISRAGRMSYGVTNSGATDTDVDIDDGVGIYEGKNDDDFIDGTADEHPASAWAGSRTTEQKMQLARKRAPVQAVRNIRQSNPRRFPNLSPEAQFKVWYHHGTLTPLPPYCKLSTMTCFQCILCWFIGDPQRNIPPLHAISSKDCRHLKFGNSTRNKMKCFMRIVEREAREKEVWIEDMGDANEELVYHLWYAIKHDFTAKYANTKRKNELTWSTVYSRMSVENVFGNKKNKASKFTEAEI